MGNNKELYTEWIKQQDKNTSYVRAIEILSEILDKNIFEEVDIEFLTRLYNDLIAKQRDDDSIYYYEKATSYGKKGFYSASIQSYIDFLQLKNTSSIKKISKRLNYYSLNQILYGPPGTGKTYNTINRALEIIDGEVSEDRAEAKKRFEELVAAGQIEFVTFHQSYGYEEFVEGIKASTIGGNISYNVEAGIFYKMCIEALYELLSFTNIESELTYSELYAALVEKFKRSGYLELESKEKKTIEIRAISKKDNLYCYHEGSTVKHTVGKDRLKKLYDKFDTIDKLNNLSNLHDEFNKIIGGANQTIYWTILHEILTLKQELKKEDLDEDVSWEMKQEIIKNVENFKYKDTSKNYILIIDEINRGNISKIFGELITLIEPSKRIGAEEEIRLRLPYSNELFGVPSNLYIIGTMNTADRSIALMDTALRRRFEFVEMMPNAELLDFDVDGVNLGELLEKINARVEYLYDRDHAIGHAYFMELNAASSLDDLNAVMRNKIIPLLQEYFYDDWEKIRLVLNDGFIRKATQNAASIFASGMDDEYIEEEKFLYSVVEEFEQESYLKICQNR